MSVRRLQKRAVVIAAVTSLVSVAASVSLSACSAILDLQSPPDDMTSGDGGHPPTTDGSFSDANGNGDGEDGSSADDGSIVETDGNVVAPICTALDAGDGAAIYSPFGQFALADGGSSIEVFDTHNLPTGFPTGYSGGSTDGHYLYFPSHGADIARFHAGSGARLNDPTAWDLYNTTSLFPPAMPSGGFSGSVFDGRYVYFIPGNATAGVVLRYDTMGGFKTASSWSVFDASAIGSSGGGGAATTGFASGVFDGRYVYLVPHNDGAADGRIVRYDTELADAGAPVHDAGSHDAGDAGAAGDSGDSGDAEPSDSAAPNPFTMADQWSSFDVSAAGAVNPFAQGFAGAVFDGTSVYFVPQSNGAFDGGLHGGQSSIALRFNDAAASFDAASSYTAFDLTTVNGEGAGFYGAATDGRYVYLVPRNNGIAFRYDRTLGFANLAAWSTFDLTRLVHPDGGLPVAYSGAAFDGRFIYYTPTGAGFGGVVRFDTLSTFSAACAWSVVDFAQYPSDAGALGFTNGLGAVFDGQYVYLVPSTTGVIARFLARTPVATLPLPELPHNFGSFL